MGERRGAKRVTTEIDEAFSRLARTYGTRHSRLHDQALEDSNNARRAYEGICGCCELLNASLKYADGKTFVQLKCPALVQPADLYGRTELGEKPECDTFQPKEEDAHC